MHDIEKIISKRRSVRTFDSRPVAAQEIEKLLTFAQTIENPYGIPVAFKLLSAKESGLVCPVVNGVDQYVGGKICRGPLANAAFGFSFEMFVLYAWSLGIGTVWLGGTMNRPAFEAAMDLSEDEIMPCASPLGYPAGKMSLREVMMRKGIKADDRLPFEALFFDGSFSAPLAREKAGPFAQPLAMVRLAPSAVNRQPWRVVVKENAAHFYLQRSKGFAGGDLDMQMIDMGIALCHFALAAQAQNLPIAFTMADPGIPMGENVEYVASYRLA